MDNILKFSDYDAFAYVACGVVAFAISDVLFDTRLVFTSGWTFSEGLLFLIAAYLAGHLVASPSSWVLEKLFVGKVLGAPTAHLIGLGPPGRLGASLRPLFRGYFAEMPKKQLSAVAQSENLTANNSVDGVFWRAYVVARHNPISSARMESFLKLYGFCRNMSFLGLATFVGALYIGVSNWCEGGWHDLVETHLVMSTAAGIVWLVLLLRYLKFYRLYALEVLLAYAKSISDKDRRS